MKTTACPLLRVMFRLLASLLFVTGLSAFAQTAVLRINAGGGAISPFVADTGYSAGNQFSSTATINTSGVTNAAPAAVYQTVRWNASFNYTLGGLTAGTSYTVRLHFVELTFTAAGQRRFNVAINGTNVLSNFDIFATVGQNHALEREFNATANGSGQIMVAFTQGTADNPSIAGLEVWTQSVPAAPTGLTASPGNAQVTLNWTASSGATTYNVYRATSSNGEGSTAIQTGVTGTSFTNTGLTNGTTYYYKVAAVNSVGTSAQSNEASAAPSASGPPPNTAVLRINAGGGAVSPFAADSGYSAGNQFSSSATINTSGVTNAAPAAVYQDVRWNASFNYTLGGLTAGSSYVVRLHFVELSFTAAGQRTFNVAINGTNVLSNFDIFAAVGQNHALEREFNATANSSGQIVVAFTQGTADNPSIAGLEIWTPAGAPAAPTGLTASPASTQVTLNWTASSGATSYNVYRGTSANGESSTAIQTGVTGTSFTNTGLTNGTTYYYKVAAVNSSGTSAQSNEASATPVAGIPSAPTGLTASPGNAQATLNWTASSGATSYNVYRGTSSNGESSTAIQTGITGTSFTNTGLSNGTTYYYKVAAVNSSGTSAQSNEASVTPSGGGNPPPNTAVLQIDAGGGAVGSFVADTGYSGGNQFSSSATITTTGVTNAAPAAVYQTVRWNPSFTYTLGGLTSGTSYVVRLHFVELSFTTAGQRVFNVAINGTSVLANFDIFANAGQNHALEREFNATANGSGQIVVSFTAGSADNPSIAGLEVWTQPTIPSAPTGLGSTAGTSNVLLVWNTTSGATSYNVYRGTASNGESGTPIATGVTTTNYSDTSVTNGTTYYYKVAAVNSAGVSALSNETSAMPHVVPPASPTLTAVAGFGNVALSWNASQGATSYNLYRSTSAGGEGSTAYVSGLTATTYTDSSVTAGTTYYYKVAAVNAAGSSAQSNEASAAPISANGRGASMPYTRYWASDSSATIGGGATHKTSPTFDKMNLASQASDQAYVELSTSGAYVQWHVTQSNAAGVTMRFTLPDTSDGMGQSGSVDCYVNNVKVQTINLTSYYMWQYFGGGGDPSDTPNGGVPAFAFDEVHWLLGTALNSGDTIRIQSTGGPVVGVDFLEIETVPAAVAQPSGSVSVTSYGASTGSSDNLAAFNSAVAAAVASPSKTLYIPAGTYKLSSMWVIGSTSSPIANLTITGAGIWYTNIQFTNSAVGGGGCSIRLSATGKMDFSNMYLNSNLRSRYNENAIYKCFMDNFGVGSHFHDLWEDHFECGFWVADYAYNPCQIASNLLIENCRIRNNLADGVNFCNGTHDSTVQNCSIRNCGDDGLAVWPNNFNGAPVAVNDTFTHDTIEFVWRAGGIAFYGGSGHKATFNFIKDNFMSSGFHVNTTFPGYHFENNTGITVSDTTIVTCGTSYDAWSGELGAVDLEASSTPVQNFTFTNIDVIDALRDGYSFGFPGGFSGIQFTNCTVNGTGLDGITTSKFTTQHLGAGICTYSAGSATFTNFTYANCAGGEIFNQGGFVLTFH
ncbi:MAG TPA: malectin domain-containing carbohydrate-binding protein [Candidatus Didemnitutus sp.]|nr:malectin domain-containing carbohydrate-binding protein [Candidatus Didemnitutus sp.]